MISEKQTLIIDSHKGNLSSKNLHLTNAHQIARRLDADLICSYVGVNDEIKSGYDNIIFNHASAYSSLDQLNIFGEMANKEREQTLEEIKKIIIR